MNYHHSAYPGVVLSHRSGHRSGHRSRSRRYDRPMQVVQPVSPYS